MKNLATIAGVSLVTFLVLFAFIKPVQNVVKEVTNLGSVTGPDSFYPVETHNGVSLAFARSGFYSATTTVVAMKSPSATSTLIGGSGCNFIVASSSAKRVVLAKATTAFATTTFLFGINTAAGAGGAALATTTTDNFVFAPNTYLVASLVGGSGTDSPTGYCSAWFQY